MSPLSSISRGTRVRILKIDGGCGMTSRLLSMGIMEGEEVIVLNNLRGSLIISKGNSRFALGRGISPRIYVEPASELEGK